jgi:hypothetical protein
MAGFAMLSEEASVESSNYLLKSGENLTFTYEDFNNKKMGET